MSVRPPIVVVEEDWLDDHAPLAATLRGRGLDVRVAHWHFTELGWGGFFAEARAASAVVVNVRPSRRWAYAYLREAAPDVRVYWIASGAAGEVVEHATPVADVDALVALLGAPARTELRA